MNQCLGQVLHVIGTAKKFVFHVRYLKQGASKVHDGNTY